MKGVWSRYFIFLEANRWALVCSPIKNCYCRYSKGIHGYFKGNAEWLVAAWAWHTSNLTFMGNYKRFIDWTLTQLENRRKARRGTCLKWINDLGLIILFLGCYSVWMWAMLQMFQRHMLSPSSKLMWLGWWFCVYSSLSRKKTLSPPPPSKSIISFWKTVLYICIYTNSSTCVVWPRRWGEGACISNPRTEYLKGSLFLRMNWRMWM